jgi:1-acyl-sn-glycerol-3-phosphate acyltransferase
MRVALSLIYWAVVALTCIPGFFIALAIFLLTFPFDRNRLVLHLYSCAWAQLYYRMNFAWSLRIAGRERIPWRGGAVIVSNHESLGDILVLFGLFRPFKWVSKQSVFQVPFIGWNMLLNGYVPLVRGNPQSVKQMLDRCERWIRRGVPVLLFPEGTRSPDGEVKAFKDGAFRLAIKMGCPVIPVALYGTSHILPKHGFVIRDGADCRVQVLEPVLPGPFGDDHAALREAVRERIIQGKQRLAAEALARGNPAAAPARAE